MGEVLKTLMPGSISASEIGRYTCEGCGNETVIVEQPVIGGPDKGKMVQYKRGCVCWENEQAREAKREQRVYQVQQMVGKYSTVNPDLEAADFDNFVASTPNLQKALSIAKEYAAAFDLERPSNLLFAGMYGLGKSHLSYSI